MPFRNSTVAASKHSSGFPPERKIPSGSSHDEETCRGGQKTPREIAEVAASAQERAEDRRSSVSSKLITSLSSGSAASTKYPASIFFPGTSNSAIL